MAIQFLNNVNADSGVLYVDAVNDRVGIGTTSPSQLLTLEGASTPSIQITDTTNNATLNISAANSRASIGTVTSHALRFITDDTERMRISHNGSVGIGTTNPTYKLQVNAGTDNQSVLFESTDATNTIGIKDSATTLSTSTGIGVVGDDLFLYAGGTAYNQRLRIQGSTGNVGIGTSSPSAVLHVNGQNGLIVGDGNETGLSINNGAYIYKIGDIDGGENQSFIEIDSPNQKTIFNNTNVGIGTTSPSRKLQVIGTDGVAKFYYNSSFTNAQYSVVDIGMMTSGTAANGFGPKITFRMGGNGYDGYTAGSIGTIRNGADNTHNLNFATSNGGSITTKMTITNTGNVGIGTTSPSEKLDVNGTVNLTNLKIATAQGSDGQVLTSTGSGIAWEDVSGGLPTTGGTMTGDLRFNNNVYARFGSTGTGDLIIGHVDFGSPYSTILENGSGDLKIQATNLLLESANGETYVDCNFNGSVDLYYNNSKKFETTNTGVSTTGNSIITGDVGINTTSPDGFLHIDGMTSSKAAIVVEAAGSGDNVIMEMQNNGAAKRMTLQYDNSNINFNITDRNDDPIITFRESGNIGIGLETPSSALEMSGSLDNTSSKLLRLTRSNQGSSPAKAVGFYSNSGERGSITVSNFATAYNTSSDYRLKENVIPIEDGINRLMSLKPCRFNFISEEQIVDGFIAHEAQDIVPEAISGEKDQIDEDGNEVYQGIDQAKLVPLLTAALQEAIKRIEILEQKNK